MFEVDFDQEDNFCSVGFFVVRMILYFVYKDSILRNNKLIYRFLFQTISAFYFLKYDYINPK